MSSISIYHPNRVRPYLERYAVVTLGTNCVYTPADEGFYDYGTSLGSDCSYYLHTRYSGVRVTDGGISQFVMGAGSDAVYEYNIKNTYPGEATIAVFRALIHALTPKFEEYTYVTLSAGSSLTPSEKGLYQVTVYTDEAGCIAEYYDGSSWLCCQVHKKTVYMFAHAPLIGDGQNLRFKNNTGSNLLFVIYRWWC